MKSFLYFLLGFVLVLSLGLAYAAEPDLQCEGGRTGEAWVCMEAARLKQMAPMINPTTNQFYADKYVDCGAAGNCPEIGFAGGTAICTSSLGYQGYRVRVNPVKIYDEGECSEPCNPPNALNAAGECVHCPSGMFFFPDYCLPYCDYSNPYIPGDIVTPPGGNGTCVMPDCGTGQVADAEGRCRPNCSENQKVNTVTGECVADCPYGTHEVEGSCVNDCLTGYYKDAETGTCVQEQGCLPGEEFFNGTCMNKCLPGETRNNDGSCDPAPVNCPFGQHEENGVCVASPVNCPPGTSFDTTANTCTQDDVEVEEETAVVHNQNGTYTETKTTTTTTTDGSITTTGGSVSGTVTTITTGPIPITGTGTGATPGTTTTSTNFTPPNIAKYESPPHSLDWTAWESQKKRFAEDGPLKILKKLQDLFNSFDVEPETPSFDFVVAGHTFNVNLHAFDEIASGCRFLMGCFMTIGAVSFGYRIYGLV